MPSVVKQKYRHVVVAVDVAVLSVRDNRLEVLLMKMSKRPYEDSWALPGGLLKGDETLDDAAKRHLFERTGLSRVYLEQLYTFSALDRDPFGRVVSTAYAALVAPEFEARERYFVTDQAKVCWFPVRKLPSLAYDHADMVQVAVERLRAKLGYTNIAANLLPPEFTLTELQTLYEVILGHALDKRNFRKKILAIKLVVPTGRERGGLPSRPAELYRFADRTLKVINIL